MTCSERHGSGLRPEISAVCLRAGFVPRVVQEVSEIQVILGLVAAGIGVSLLPRSVVRVRQPGLVCRALEPPETVECVLAWRQEDATPVLRTFLKVVAEFAG